MLEFAHNFIHDQYTFTSTILVVLILGVIGFALYKLNKL